MSDWSAFGDRASFGLEVRLVEDDQAGGPGAYAWSYGEWRIYLRGTCLTRHSRPNGETREAVRWYLAPLMTWLSKAWTPLFHEQFPPASVRAHDNLVIAFEQAERMLLEDEGEGAGLLRAEMQAWRSRHSIWSGAAGGIFPNLWFRRQSDLIEISYDPGPTVGAPEGLQYQFNRGSTLIDVEVVAKVFGQFLEWGRVQAVAHNLDPNLIAPSVKSDTTARDIAEDWFLGGRLATLLRAKRRTPNVQQMHYGVLHPLSPEVAMFGTLTPNLSDNDAATLLATLSDARTNNPEPDRLRDVSIDRSPPTRESAWGEGYEVALETLEQLDATRNEARHINLIAALSELGVAVQDVEVDDQSLRGVAIAGPGLSPTIVVNTRAKWNRTNPGYRFTLAHELAHILVDRGSARTITHSSTPWAPEAVERRANAFAAMFLMPYRLVDAALSAFGKVTDARSLGQVARRLECGKSAVLEHLSNIDRIDPSVFYRIKGELAQP
jgi:Zn-dependent peptidase ImmA (M78 family)